VKLFWLLLVAAAGCAAQTPVIVISIDTLRADHLSAWGYHKIRTPHIDSFADGGTLFSAAEAQVPLTLPSHTVLFTSTYPFENHVEENAGKVPRNLETLASVFHGHGYKTAAFIGSIFLEKQLGLDRGFDTYDSPFSFEAFSRLSGEMLFAGKGRNAYSVRERRPGALVLRAANQWLAAHRGQPVFVFVHLFDMHKPWQLGSYDAQLENVDELIGGFEQGLKNQGWWDRSLVALLADHGEGLGDHGESDHGYFIYESTLHVPLVVHWPRGTPKSPPKLAPRIDTPIGLIDVGPTILDFLKIPAPASFRGRSMMDASPRPVFSESVYAHACFGWSDVRSLREGAYKYIEAPRPELYDLSRDPREVNNLVRTRAGEASRLRGELLKFRPPSAPRVSPSGSSADGVQAKKAALASLGYIAPGPVSSQTAGADLKDRLPELLRYEEALTLLSERRLAAAISAFRAILKSDPHNLLARRDLGVVLIEQKDYTRAAEELRQVAGASPNDYVTRYELGVAQESLGRMHEALAEFEIACSLAPGAAQCSDALARVRTKIR
jgi:choline-sulfatase